MIIVSGTAKTKPGTITKLRAVMETTIRETRKEEGCILYTYGIDVLDPDTIVVVEHWESWAALEKHFTTPHIAAWMTALSQEKAVVSKVKFMEAGEERNPLG